MAHFPQGLSLATWSGRISQRTPHGGPLASCQPSLWLWVQNLDICEGLRHERSESGRAQTVHDHSQEKKWQQISTPPVLRLPSGPVHVSAKTSLALTLPEPLLALH